MKHANVCSTKSILWLLKIPSLLFSIFSKLQSFHTLNRTPFTCAKMQGILQRH